VRRTGGIPSLSGKDPVGHIHFLRTQRPDVYAATAVFLEPVDYLNLRLTGLARASHDSITLHWVTDNRDINAIAYDDALIGLAGLERATLPELVPTGSVLGGLAPAAAVELGLLAGTPVIAGMGDLHSAAVGSGAVADFDAHLYIGTSSWVSCHVPFKKTDALTNIASIPSGLPGRYLVADEHETGGACLTWLRDNLLFPDDALSAGATPGPPDNFFGILNDVASSVPVGSRGVLFTPWLNGERSPVDDHTIRGGFHNISLSSTRADMVRAVFEGVALNSAWLLGAVEKYCKRSFPSLAFVGGGANSDLWSQIHADATGRTIRQIQDPVLANVHGAGLLTLLALGYLTIDDIPGTVTVKATYQPDPVAGELYAARLKEFINLYEKTKAIHKRLNGRRLIG
jgi:xylulokinase